MYNNNTKNSKGKIELGKKESESVIQENVNAVETTESSKKDDENIKGIDDKQRTTVQNIETKTEDTKNEVEIDDAKGGEKQNPNSANVIHGKIYEQNLAQTPIAEYFENKYEATTYKAVTSLINELRSGVTAENWGQSYWTPSGGKSVYKVIKEGIPSFVKPEVSINEENKRLIEQIDNRYGIMDQRLIKESYNLVGAGLQYSRFVQNLDVAGLTIPDINDVKSGEGLLPVPTVISDRTTQTKKITAIMTQIINFAKCYFALNRVIVSGDAKLVMDATGVDDAIKRFFMMKPAVHDNPHPVWAALVHEVPWMVEEITSMVTMYPPLFGELEVESAPNNVKLSSTMAVTTDQYMSDIINTSSSSFKELRALPEEWLEMARACNSNDISNLELKNPSGLYLPNIHRPTVEMQNAYLLYTLVSKEAKVNIIQYLTNYVNGLNRLNLVTADKIFDMKDNPGSSYLTSYYAALRRLLAVGTTVDLPNLVVLETFTGIVDIKLRDAPGTDMAGNFIVLAGLLSWFIAFPRIANSIRFELGYRIMQALEGLFGARNFSQYTNLYGWTRQLVNGQWQIYDSAKDNIGRLTRATPDNILPSIFTPQNLNSPSDKFGRDLKNLITGISALCEPSFVQVTLDLKRRAKYFPYVYDDYVAHSSWEYIDKHNLVNQVEGNVTARIHTLSRLLDDANKLYMSLSRNLRFTNTTDWYTSFLSTFTYGAESATPFFNFTLPSIQLVLMNSPFFVYDEVRRDNPKLYPNLLGLGSIRVNQVEQLNREDRPIPVDQPVYYVDSMMALMVLLGGSGEYKRYSSISSGTKQGGSAEMPMEVGSKILLGDPSELLSFYYDIMRISSKVAFPLKMLHDLIHPNSRNNLISAQAQQLKRLFLARNYSDVALTMFKLAGVHDSEAFLKLLTTNGVIDGRYTEPRLVWITKTMPQQELRVDYRGMILDRTLTILDVYDTRIMSTLAKLFLDVKSPLLNIQNGLCIGRLVVSERSPFSTLEYINTQFPVVVDFADITMQWTSQKIGTGLQVTIDGTNFLSPFDKGLSGIRINIDDFALIQSSYIKWFATAIVFGNIMMYCPNKSIKPKIDYHKTRIDYVNENLMSETIEKILSQDAGAVMEWDFVSTMKATNFITNVETVPSYYQYVTMTTEPKENIISSVVTTTVVPMENHDVLDPTMWGFGERIDLLNTYLPGTSIRKLDAGKLSMNNPMMMFYKGSFENEPILVIEPKYDAVYV